MALKPEVLFHCLKDDLSAHFGSDFVAKATQFGPFWPDMSHQEAAACSLLNSFLKKLETGRTEETDQAALVKFLACNSACENWQLPSQFDSKTETLLGEYKRAIYEFWFKDGFALWNHPYSLLDQGRVGPGANIEARGGDFYTKLFSSPLSCSHISLYSLYSRYTQSFPVWRDAEINRKNAYGEASVRPSSRLSFVPKNDEISRCICIEPTLNTYFQLGMAEILNRRLSERFGISLDTQQFKNRNLARLGSITDGLSTIDLSSASDSISVAMLKYSLPPDFFRELMKYRCAAVDIKGRGTVPLHMVSTMGNGFTFPLQTMLFACVVVACMRFRGIPVRGSGSDQLWGVNGDDIVCPKLVTSDVINLLALLGFSVNNDKTFVEGPFRESCGSDFFRGTDIRGVYVKTLSTPGSRYSVINSLARFSTKHGICLTKTLRALYNSVKFLPVPRWANSDSGIQLPLSIARKHLQWDRSTYSYRYMSYEPLACYLRCDDEKIVVPRRSKSRIYNPDGLLISFLQRSVYSSKIGVRVDHVPYRAKRRFTSCWDSELKFIPGHPDYGMDWQRWESAVSTHYESRVEIR
jgi:hypothetical protein